MKKPPEDRYRLRKTEAVIDGSELSKIKTDSSIPDVIRVLTFEEIVAQLPLLFEDYRSGQIRPHHREFLEEIRHLRFKPAIQLMLAMDMREGNESYLRIMTKYIDQIYTQSEIGTEDIEFLKEIFRYAQQKQNFEAIGTEGIDAKISAMTVQQIIEEIFRYRNVIHLKSELISALWHAVNRGI